MTGPGSALSLLTVIGRGAPPTPAATAWFPVVGVGLGAVLGGIWWTTAQIWPAAIAAVIVVSADLALTGMLHFDGLADSADGLLPHMTARRRLQVMAAPDTGAFAVAVVGAVLLARFAALAALLPSPLLLAALWGTSRSVMVLGMARLPYARPGGIADGFTSPRTLVPALLGLAACAVLAAVWHLPAGALAVVGAVAVSVGTLALAKRRIGGYTGDVLGAAGVLAETVGLLIAAARW